MHPKPLASNRGSRYHVGRLTRPSKPDQRQVWMHSNGHWGAAQTTTGRHNVWGLLSVV